MLVWNGDGLRYFARWVFACQDGGSLVQCPSERQASLPGAYCTRALSVAWAAAASGEASTAATSAR